MRKGGLFCVVACFTLAATPFGCTSVDSSAPPPESDASTVPTADSSLDVSTIDGSSPALDAAADIQVSPDANDGASAPDSPPPVDANEASALVDAADSAAEDASDATIADAADASAPDDASVADATADAGPDAADAGACALNPLAASWDVTADFSGTTNPCGVWTYGYALSLGSTPLTVYTSTNGSSWTDPSNDTSGTPTVWENETGATLNGVQPGQVSEHPGPHGEYSTSRWTAPRAGTFSIAVQFFAGDIGTTDGAVLHGTTVLFESNTNASPTFATTLTLAAGDTLDVAVGLAGGETYNYGNTPVTAVITEGAGPGDANGD